MNYVVLLNPQNNHYPTPLSSSFPSHETKLIVAVGQPAGLLSGFTHHSHQPCFHLQKAEVPDPPTVHFLSSTKQQTDKLTGGQSEALS